MTSREDEKPSTTVSASDTNGLNARQHEAVTTGDGVVVVLAGPGSGKTAVLTRRVEHLIRKQGVPPGDVCCLTFTNKAAREMADRVRGLLGPVDSASVFIGTFHRLCSFVLRQHGWLVNLDSHFKIITSAQASALLRQVLEGMNIKDIRVDTLLSTFARAKIRHHGQNWLLSEAKRSGNDAWEVVPTLYAQYELTKEKEKCLDFDDLLVNTRKLFRQQSDVRKIYATRFRYVMVDEFQDTTPLQLEITKHLTSHHNNLFIVGDPDQSIYSFRQADRENINRVLKSYPTARVIALEECYRSTSRILHCSLAMLRGPTSQNARSLWTRNKEGPPVMIREFLTSEKEAASLACEISRMLHPREQEEAIQAEDIAILYRTNSLGRAIEEQLSLQRVPYYTMGGKGIGDHKEIQLILAFLRLAVDRRDAEAFKIAASHPAIGTSRTLVQDIIRTTTSTPSSDYVEIVRKILSGDSIIRKGLTVSDRVMKKSQDSLRRLSNTLSGPLEQGKTCTATEGVAFVLRTTDLRETHMNSEIAEEELEKRWEAVEDLVSAAQRFDWQHEGATSSTSERNLAQFLEEVAMATERPGEGGGTGGPGKVTCSTIHAAKGGEWRVVFVIALEMGVLPHGRTRLDPDALEEEKRLFYVALTRAKHALHLSYARSRAEIHFVSESSERDPSAEMDSVDVPVLCDSASPTQENSQSLVEERRDPVRAHSELKSGRELLANGKPSMAIARFDCALRLDSQLIEAYKLRGQANRQNKNLAAALRDFRTCLEHEADPEIEATVTSLQEEMRGRYGSGIKRLVSHRGTRGEFMAASKVLRQPSVPVVQKSISAAPRRSLSQPNPTDTPFQVLYEEEKAKRIRLERENVALRKLIEELRPK